MVATFTHPQRPARRQARLIFTGAILAAAAATSLLTAAPAAFAAKLAPCPGATTPISQSTRTDTQRAVLCLVNQQRVAAHLPALVNNAKLDLSAQRWTDSMVGSADFSHGNAFMDRISAVGFDWSTVGENIATGYSTPQSVVTAWMASPGHCANILDPAYRDVGTGVSGGSINGSSNIPGTWTQDFGRLMSQPALSSNVGPAQACYHQ